MKKELIPINVKTNSFGPLIYRTKDNVIHFYQYYGIMESMGDEHHNLYFIEDVKIEKGDYFYSVRLLIEKAEINYPAGEHIGKVIATTNPILIHEGVLGIPERYVRHYAYRNGDIDSVEIEMEPEYIHSNKRYFPETPKLKDKEVIIYEEPAAIVMKTKLVEKTDELVIIEWSGPTGHGVLTLKYNNKGGYTCDAEYIGLETMFEIIKNTELLK